jgi:hypothetical protein
MKEACKRIEYESEVVKPISGNVKKYREIYDKSYRESLNGGK